MSIYAPVTLPKLMVTQPTITPVQSVSSPVNNIPGYVYRLTFKPTNQYYIGYRQQNISENRMPCDDFLIYYFTSSDDVKAMIAEHGLDKFEYVILFESTDVDAVYWYEQQVIKEHINDELSLNKQYVKEGQVKFVATSAGGKKAAETRKRRGTDKIAIQKTLVTKAANGTAKIGGQKSLATKIKKGITKEIGAKSAATRRANGTMASSLKAASESRMKTWEFTSPTGEVQVIVNLQKFCRDNGLGATAMRNVNKGKMKNHRGWTCKCLSTPPVEWQAEYDKNIALRVPVEEKKYSNVGTWKITKPDGEILIVENLRQFCRDNGLNNSCMLDVSKGRHVTHKGWSCEIISKEQPVVFWEVTNPTGEVFTTIDLKQCCIDNGLLLKTMKKIANGYTINHRGGWTCKRL